MQFEPRARTSMKFGLFHQMQFPKPWPAGEHTDYRIHWDTLEEAERAEQAGFDTFWLTEHHFYEEIGHSSAPEVFLAARRSRGRPAPAWPSSASRRCRSTS